VGYHGTLQSLLTPHSARDETRRGKFQLPSSGCQYVTLWTHFALSALQVFPVHMLLIADDGINIIENYYLEELAEARANEFLLVVPPLKIRGGTGSALRSFALVPKD
jgi:kynurenine formamidase